MTMKISVIAVLIALSPVCAAAQTADPCVPAPVKYTAANGDERTISTATIDASKAGSTFEIVPGPGAALLDVTTAGLAASGATLVLEGMRDPVRKFWDGTGSRTGALSLSTDDAVTVNAHGFVKLRLRVAKAGHGSIAVTATTRRRVLTDPVLGDYHNMAEVKQRRSAIVACEVRRNPEIAVKPPAPSTK
jgi:hypothetical protein